MDPSLRLDEHGQQVIDEWLAKAPNELHDSLYAALFAIVNGTWHVIYRHWDDLNRPMATVMKLSDEEVLVWRTFPEWPDIFRVLYIGKPDY